MRRVTKVSLQDALTRGLKLKDPEFRLERYGGRWSGSVISDTFKGKGDYRRQQMIWDALKKAFGPDAIKLVGMLLAYSRYEWDLDAEVAHASKH